MDQLIDISAKFLGRETERSKGKEEFTTSYSLEKYRALMESGEYMQINFEKVDADGTLSKVEENVLIQMKPDEITGEAYDLHYKSQKLADVYYVRVINIDEGSHTVWVSHNAARMDKRPELEQEINRRLENKEPIIRVKGKVLRIQTKMVNGESTDIGVWLDLCGVGILGYVYIGDYANTYTSALKGLIGYGDILEVNIKEKKVRTQRNKQVTYYTCSRKELIENPWDQKSLQEKYHEGDIVRIKCLTLREGHWFGEINGLNIQVFTEYPSAIHNFPIIPGMEYMGKIYHMDVKGRSLKARVFQALTLDGYAQPKQQKNKEVEEK